MKYYSPVIRCVCVQTGAFVTVSARVFQFCHVNHLVFNGSAPSAGGCMTKTRICLMLKKSQTSEVSAWRKSSPVTVTTQTLSARWRVKVMWHQHPFDQLLPLLVRKHLSALLLFYYLKCFILSMPQTKNTALTVLQTSHMSTCKGRLSGSHSFLKRKMD